MQTYLRPILITLAILLTVYLSLDIQNLDSERRRPETEVFDVEKYVADIWENQIPRIMHQAIEIPNLLDALAYNPEEAFRQHSKVLGISNTHYFLVQGNGVITSVNEETITVAIQDTIIADIATVFIFGNTVRDASGLVDISDFANMMDFNQVSVQMNRLIRNERATPLRNQAQPGMAISLIGATEINRLEEVPSQLFITPIHYQLHDE